MSAPRTPPDPSTPPDASRSFDLPGPADPFELASPDGPTRPADPFDPARPDGPTRPADPFDPASPDGPTDPSDPARWADWPQRHWPPMPPPPDRPLVPAAGYLPLPADAPVPPARPAGSKPRRWLLVAGVGCLLAAVLCGLLTVLQDRSDRSPQAVVRRYFAALAAGNAAAALGFAASPPDGSYLTAAVLRQQLELAPLTDVSVRDVELTGGHGTVSVSYRLGFADGAEQLTDSVPVIRHGLSWRLDRVATRTSVTGVGDGADRLVLAGGKLPAQPVLLFPGALPVGTDSPALHTDRPVVRLGEPDQASAVTVSLTDATRNTLQSSLNKALAGCLAGGATQSDCPQPADGRPVPGSLRGTALPMQVPPLMVLGAGGKVYLSALATVRGSWQDWDFNNQPVRHTGDTSLKLHAVASVADLGRIYWSGS